MTIAMFITIAAICCAVSVLLTEGIKTWCKNANKGYSANLIALLTSLIAGGGGTSAAYILMDIPFNATNITCIVLMIVTVWLGGMIGYDKVMQLVTQITSKKQ